MLVFCFQLQLNSVLGLRGDTFMFVCILTHRAMRIYFQGDLTQGLGEALMQKLFMVHTGQVALSPKCLGWTPRGTSFFKIVPRISSWLNKLHSPIFSIFLSLQLVWKADTGPQRWKRIYFQKESIAVPWSSHPWQPIVTDNRWTTSLETLSTLRIVYSWRSHLSDIAASCLSGTYGCYKNGS